MPTCLLCDGPLEREVFPFATNWNAADYRYRRCERCGSTTIDPLPDDEQIAAMYRWSDYHEDFYSDLAQEASESRLAEIMPALGGSRTLLDFGCGNGSFLRLAASRGLSGEGVELDEAARRIATENSGCPVHSLEEVEGSGRSFDIIHLGDVLEHLREPADMLRRLEPLLGETGKFFIEGPVEANASLVRAASVAFGEARAKLGRRTVGSHPPYHLFQATAEAQRDFFVRKMGYAVDRYLVWETGWPYRLPGGGVKSRSEWVRDLIGRAAIGFADLSRLAGLRLGNRFAAVVRPARGAIAGSMQAQRVGR